MISRCRFIRNLDASTFEKLNFEKLKGFKSVCPFARKLSDEAFDACVAQSESMPQKQYSFKKMSAEGFDYDGFFDEKVQEKKSNNTYRVFKRIKRNAGDFPKAVSFETDTDISLAHLNRSKNVSVWCSNDYLGLSRHPKIIENAVKVIRDHGVGSGGTRNISGNQLMHEELENSLAKWYHKEAGLIFTSCYVANTTTLYTLGRMLPGCIFISDSGNHASMIEGIRNSKATKYIFKHNDPEDLKLILSSLDKKLPKIVAFESLNSMSGSISPIKELCDIAHSYNALTFIDEVHATGLYGNNGSGQGEAQDCLADMDIISGTFGKAVGSMGGFIAGSKNLVDTVRSYGSGLIFTTSLSPVLVSTALLSIDILKSMEGRYLREEHQKVANILRSQLMKRGFPIFRSLSHILPIHIGDATLCRKISDTLLKDYDIYVQAINYPTVSFGTERLRFAPSPLHNEEMIEKLLVALDNIWNLLDVPLLHQKCDKGPCNCISHCLNYSKPTHSYLPV